MPCNAFRLYCRYLCMNKSERLAEEKNGVLRFMYSSLCVDVVTFCMFSKQEIHRGGCNFLTCDVTLHSLESDELVSYTHHTLHTMIHFKGQYLTSSNQLFLYAHMSRIIQAVYFIYIYIFQDECIMITEIKHRFLYTAGINVRFSW